MSQKFCKFINDLCADLKGFYEEGSESVGRILFAGQTGVTTIRLGDRLPGRSSHLPARSGGPPCGAREGAARAYSMLLRVGFGVPAVSPRPR